MTDNTNESALGAAGGSSPNEQAANPNGQQSSSGDAALQQLDYLGQYYGLSANEVLQVILAQ